MLFETAGPVNTDKTLETALEFAEKNNLAVVVATHSGETGVRAAKMAGGRVPVVVVAAAENYGAKRVVPRPLLAENVKELRRLDIPVVSSSHVLSGAERCMSARFGGVGPTEMIAHTLRMFGAGVKVAVEISVMALDARALSASQKVVAVAGTFTGADTAIVVSPAPAAEILNTHIDQILCKPGGRKA